MGRCLDFEYNPIVELRGLAEGLASKREKRSG